MSIEFKSWAPFHARKNTDQLKRWLNNVGRFSEEAFRNGMGLYPPASAPGNWPNSRTGRLRASIKATVTDTDVTISTNTPYSGYLRLGTSKMARRKMSDDALQAGMRRARLGRWVEFTTGGTTFTR